MEEVKIPKQKPYSSFNKRLPAAKKPEGTMTKGEYNKGCYGSYNIDSFRHINRTL